MIEMNKKLLIIIFMLIIIYVLLFIILYWIYNIHLVLLDFGIQVKIFSEYFVNLIEILKKIK